MKAIIVLIAISTLLFAMEVSNATRPDLYGMVVVIDPGHGGRDPGSHGIFPGDEGILVVEDEYVSDVARRLARMLKKRGAIVFSTTVDKKQHLPIAGSPASIIPPDKNERYSLDGSMVRGGTDRNMAPRTLYANKKLKAYENHRVVFISLHFDSMRNGDLSGVHFIGPERGKPEIAIFLEEEFRKEKRLRSLNGSEYYTYGNSGDRSRGIANMFVLRNGVNFISQRILIELGNFSNPGDLWRIRDYRVREHYSQIILRALIRLNRLPLAKCR